MKAFPGRESNGWSVAPVLCWVMAACFGSCQNAVAAAPANDSFADRIVISDANIPVTGSTLGATEEAGEPQGSTKTVWYSWEAVEGEPFAFVMEHSTFVETARIYRGDSLETLQLVTVPLPSAGPVIEPNGQVYHIQISSQNGSSGDFRFAIRSGVSGTPIILNDPDSQGMMLGTTSTISVTAKGENLEYQWFKNGAILEGATNHRLTFETVKEEDAGEYFVRISNSFGEATSPVARLSVHPPFYVQTLHTRNSEGTFQRFDIRAVSAASNGIIYFAGDDGVFEMAQSGVVRRISEEIRKGDLMTYFAASNVVYLTDGVDSKIHKIENGEITTIAGVAGTGYLDGPVATAQFGVTTGLAVAKDGTMYVAELGNKVIRKIQDGVVSTYAGQVGVGRSRDGIATEATLGSPLGLTLDASAALFAADGGANTIRMISTNGLVSTFARGFDLPQALVLDEAGNLIVTDLSDGLLWLIRPDGAKMMLTGRGFNADGLGQNARIREPFGIAIDGAGNFLIADRARLVRRGFWLDGSTPPIVTTANVVLQGTEGSNLELKAEVSGTEPITFQWFRNNVAVEGATSATFPIVNLSTNDAGTYYLSASNAFGVTTSTNLTVSVSPSFVWDVPVRDGTEFVFTIGTTDGSVPPAGTLTNLQMQTSADLVEWQTVETVPFLTNGQHQFRLQLSEPHRFYRALGP